MNSQFKQPQRHFLPQDFEVTGWASIQPFYEELLSRELSSSDILRQWFLDRSELEGVLSEDMGWRYINMTCDTNDKASVTAYKEFVTEISPQIAPWTHKLNEKAMQCPHIAELRQEAGFDILVRCMEQNIQIYRSQNIPLFTDIQLQAQTYGQIAGDMTVIVEDQELTLQQAATYLEKQNRDLRARVYEQVGQRRLKDKDALDDLYTKLIHDRHQVALNADFENFRDYAFVDLHRFDYTPADCFAFHKAVEKEVVPLLNELAEERQALLGVDVLKPWDKHVDPTGQSPLRPFRDAKDLLQTTITVFGQLNPFLGDCLRTMHAIRHFDLESRKGKAPGGYNYPLDETGIPFIFMNATTTLQDMVTLLHEGGHAIHSFLTRDLPIHSFKHPPSELAELASMSMELLTMDLWGNFFANEADLRRAKKQHITQIVETLAWVATIDQFQHWVYEHPQHTPAQRKEAWNETLSRFTDKVTNWSGQEAYKDYLWQKQLHLFEVPFYYIEYGIAQLGAVAMWKHTQENPQQGLQDYLAALKLGYTRSVPEVYQRVGIRFDFSEAYIRELMQFVKAQIA